MTRHLANAFGDLRETQPSEELAWLVHALLIYPLWPQLVKPWVRNPQSTGKFLIHSLTSRVHSSWADLTACFWVIYRELVAITGSYVVSLLRKRLQWGFSHSKFTLPSGLQSLMWCVLFSTDMKILLLLSGDVYLRYIWYSDVFIRFSDVFNKHQVL